MFAEQLCELKAVKKKVHFRVENTIIEHTSLDGFIHVLVLQTTASN